MKVTVIIPTYKRHDVMIRAVKSVLNQTLTDLEVLVVNDCKDDQDELNEKLKSLDDKRVTSVQNARTKGANGARNTGMLLAKGDYIAFLDDDDEWLPNKLRQQVQGLSELDDEYGMIFSSYLVENKGEWSEHIMSEEGYLTDELVMDKVKCCGGSNLLMKRAVVESIGLWDEDLLRQQDLEFIIRISKKFKLMSLPDIALKVYGHNTPNPNKAFREREKFVIKIRPFIEELSTSDKSRFFSTHYRRQAIYLASMAERKRSVDSWLKAVGYQMIDPRKDIKWFFKLLKG